MKQTIPSAEIVIVLAQHPVLGHLLLPYTVARRDNEMVQLAEQAFHAPEGLIDRLSAPERKAIDIAAHYTEKYLTAVYSKEKSSSVFLHKLTEKKYKEQVRPYIEKKLLEMIKLIVKYKLPLYEKQAGSNLLYEHHRYEVNEQSSSLSFHFTLTKKLFSYAIKCSRNGDEVSLPDKKPVIVLSSSPAVLMLGRELHVFNHIEASRILPFTHKAQVSVDASLSEKYMENIVLPAMRYHHVTASGFDIVKESVSCEPHLTVNLTPGLDWGIRLHFTYGDQEFTHDACATAKIARLDNTTENIRIVYFERDIARENEAYEFLKASGLKQVSDKLFIPKNTHSNDSSPLVSWLYQNKELLHKRFVITNETVEAEYCLEDIRIEQFYKEDDRDWFELNIQVIIDGMVLPFTHFRKHILEGNREFVLPSGKIMLLPEDWFSKYSGLLQAATVKEDKTIRVRRSLVGLVQSAFSEDGKKTGPYQPKRLLDAPEGFRAQLRHYQQAGLSWMVHLYEHRFNGCLADDMGLGKTIQTLALLQYVYNAKAKHASLIVVPTSLLHNWAKEGLRFTNLSIGQYEGNGVGKKGITPKEFNQYHIVLTSYGIMRNNISELSKYVFEYVILDESQSIKNSDSFTFKAAVTLKGNHRLVLTGTPIENSLKDLWAQFCFLQPDLLGSERHFTKNFILPIRQGNEVKESELKRLLEPFILRRSKSDVAPELPSLTEEVLYCGMTEQQEELYKDERNRLRSILLHELEVESEKRNFTIINGIMRLRQLACHPKLTLKDFHEESGKMEEIVGTFETLRSEGHKVLIFSSFVQHLELVAKAFTKRKWKYAMLTGSTTNREEEITRFADDENIQAFLISLKAGGVGLNLTQADYIFIIDPWWNPAAEMQAIGRAHRIGQQKQVMAYRFITQDSIEEKMMQLQAEKRKLAESFITDNNPLDSLTDSEWEMLLT